MFHILLGSKCTPTDRSKEGYANCSISILELDKNGKLIPIIVPNC